MQNSFDTQFLDQIVTILKEGMDSQSTFEAIFKLVATTIPFDSATLYLYQSQDDRLELIYHQGTEIVELAPDVDFERGKGISSWISKQKKPVILESLTRARPGREQRFSSFVAMPLWTPEKLVGVFNIGHNQPGIYNRKDMRRFEIIASQLSMIVDRMQLRRELERKNVQLEKAIKELKRTQSQLIEKERLATIGEVAVTVNHEINNPLTSIIGLAEVLEISYKTGKDDKVKAGLRGILKEAKRIRNVTRKLANVSSSRPVVYLDSSKMIDINQ